MSWPRLLGLKQGMVPRTGIAAFAVLAILYFVVHGNGDGQSRADAIEVAPLSPEDLGLAPKESDIIAYYGGLRIIEEDDLKGSYSALLIGPGDDSLTTVSDQGQWLELRPRLHDNRLVGLAVVASDAIMDEHGEAVEEKQRDAESLASDGAGGLVVSFEREHRFWRYEAGGSPWASRPQDIAVPAALRALPGNAGIEALTRLCDGRYLAIAQKPLPDDAAADTAWIGNAGSWQSITYPYLGDWRPTGATTLPDCSVAILERRSVAADAETEEERGNTRIMRLASDSFAGDNLTGGGQTWDSRELIRLSLAKSDGQFEGIAATTKDGGDAWLYLISDNDGRKKRHTVVVRFRFGTKDGAG